jgi:hypothetical protein
MLVADYMKLAGAAQALPESQTWGLNASARATQAFQVQAGLRALLLACYGLPDL